MCKALSLDWKSLLLFHTRNSTPPPPYDEGDVSYGPGAPLPQYIAIRVHRRFSASVAGSCAAQLMAFVAGLPKNVSGGSWSRPTSVALMTPIAPMRSRVS